VSGQPVRLWAGLESFKQRRAHAVSRFRHDQACSAAEMFVREWGELAAEFGWQLDDIFGSGGLAFWLETEIVTALGPEHAITERGRAFDRITRRTWVNPYEGETRQ
jgi:hypothetical protein